MMLLYQLHFKTWSGPLQPHEEVSLKMYDTAGGTPALPFEEASSSISSTPMFNIPLFPNKL
jgi:hypothetical protein